MVTCPMTSRGPEIQVSVIYNRPTSVFGKNVHGKIGPTEKSAVVIKKRPL